MNEVRIVEKEHFKKMDNNFLERLRHFILQRMLVLSTPIVANLGRFPERPVTACSVPPVDLKDDIETAIEIAYKYSLDGMGTSFSLDSTNIPLKKSDRLVQFTDEFAEKEPNSRPVGSITTMNIRNPDVKNFIWYKPNLNDQNSRLNSSVLIDNDFMDAVSNNREYELWNGSKLNARSVFDQICHANYICGEPGIVFIDNIESRNPLKSHKIESVATCGEIGLCKGETCLFASINIVEFEKEGSIDYTSLRDCIELTVRFLDDMLNYSLQRFNDPVTREIVQQFRKIGLGLCGISLLLAKLDLSYGSEESKELLVDILSFINYHSKSTSIDLAKERGSIYEFNESEYYKNPSYFYNKFDKYPTRTVKSKDWKKLDNKLRRYGIRNSMTVILPPTGVSSLISKTSPQMEPLFSLNDNNSNLKQILKEHLEQNYGPEITIKVLDEIKETGTLQNNKIVSDKTKSIFRTAVEIPKEEHIAILEIAQRFVDGGIAKTVNLPNQSTTQDIADTILLAFNAGLNGITMYRDGSKNNQPFEFRKNM